MSDWDEVATALARLERFTSSIMAASPKEAEKVSFNDLRNANTVLRQSMRGEYGDESDPWPEDTAERIKAMR